MRESKHKTDIGCLPPHRLTHKIKAAVRVISFIYRDKSRCASNHLVLVALLERVTQDSLDRQSLKTIIPDSTRIETNPKDERPSRGS